MKSYFTDIFIKRPVLAMVVSLLILILGLRSLGMLNVRQYPKTESAQVTVNTAYFGADAALVKGFITTPLEKSIAQADGIDYIESSSTQGVSSITAHLQLNYDPNAALTQITAKVNAVINQLPPQSQQPQISVAEQRGQAYLYIAFYSDILDNNQVTDYLTRVVVPTLSAVPGVQLADVLGAREFAMRIWLDPNRMAAFDVTGTEVRNVLQANNYLSAVGQTKGSMIKVNLTASTDIHSVDEFRNLVIKHEGDTLVRLKDVANVTLGAENYDTTIVFDGHPATFIGIQVVPTANPLTVIEGVRDAFPQIRKNLPPGLKAELVYDATQYMNDSIDEVVSTIAEALAIVIVVIFLFLGSIRSVIIPVIAMPLSLVGAFFVMYVLGFSINLLTLLAMVLAIGLVVDDAIIVVENIHRHIEEGMSPFKAALQGTRELGTSIIAMSITLIAVYAPIGFLTGLTGTLFSEFAFTVAGAVLISGIVALTLSPMMCSKFLKPDTGKHGFVHFLDERFEWLQMRYRRMLHGALNYRPVTVVFAAIVLASCYFLFTTTQHELAPTEDQGFVLVQAQAAPTATLDYLTLYTDQMNNIFKSIPERDHFFEINGMGSTDTAFAGFVMKSWSHRDRSQEAVKNEIYGRLQSIAGLRTVAFTPPSLPGSGGGLGLQVVVASPQPPEKMLPIVQRLMQSAQQSGLFMFVDTDLKFDKPLVNIVINRQKVADLGLTMADVGADLSSMLGGGYVNYFALSGRSYRVIAQVKREARLNPEQLEHYYISTPDAGVVPLSTIASLEKSVIPESLNRFQQLNAATISAAPAPGVTLGQAIDYMQNQAAQMLPNGYTLGYKGQSRQYIQESGALLATFFFAIIIIFLVLAALFESFRDPFIVLISVPMSISGALIFLSLGVATINIYTEVGLITLIGLISKHGILIVQFANQLQAQGKSKREAIEEAAGIRLRPILMTTAAMVMGVVPLLTAAGPGAVSRFDIGLVIAAGMAIGTLFTLFVVPTMYLLLAKRVEKDDSDSGLQPVTEALE
ncbi:MAG TPA: efflux RND transporter permease subunit [Gammaproteobacteria bacterium]|nr:efflux RND transporter permease subunit [Gammaproteobacteria bacterium]